MKNKNIKNLIVGIDLSDYSKIVVREAKMLAEKMAIPMNLVFVCPADWYAPAYKAEIIQRTTERINKIYKLDKKINVSIKFGKADTEVIGFAKKFTNPMIIVGYKGHSGLLNMLLGSTAEKIAQKSPFPVWIQRGNKIIVPKNILVPSDLSQNSDHTVEGVKLLSKPVNGKFELYYVLEEPTPLLDYSAWASVYTFLKKEEDKKLKLMKAKYPNLKTSKNPGNVASHILQYSKKFDLIAITPKNPKKRFPIFGSVNAKLVRSSEKPVLIYP